MNNDIRNSFLNPLEIMPEDYYYDTVRGQMVEILSKVSFDPILVDTVERTMNKADSSSTNKQYRQLEQDLYQLSIALLSKNYTRTNDFVRASEEEKKIIVKFTKDLQELLTIITCTKEPVKEEVKFKRERLNYDEKQKENIIYSKGQEEEIKGRLPNKIN